MMLMAMLSWKPNLYVINDNQAMFSSHIGLHGDKMVRHAAEQRRLLSAFSVNGLRDAWSQEAAHLVQVMMGNLSTTRCRTPGSCLFELAEQPHETLNPKP